MAEEPKPRPQALQGAPRPEEAVEPSLAATTEAAHNESPPTGAAEPAVPARDYPRDVRLLQFANPAPPLPRDRTLVRFFRFLASLLFWGGSATGLAILLYRAVVLPRLIVLSSRLGELYGHHLIHYGKFVDETRKMAISNDVLCPKTAALAAAVATPLPKDETKDEAVQTTLDDEKVGADRVATQSDVPASTSRPPSRSSETREKAVGPDGEDPPQDSLPARSSELFDTLKTSLATLTAEVNASTRPEQEEGASAPKQLADSLELLSSYISTQSFHATQMKLNLGGGAFGPVPAPNGVAIQNSPAGEAAAQCRSEIRGLKGLLLNRRNFALLERWDDDDDTLPQIVA